MYVTITAVAPEKMGKFMCAVGFFTVIVIEDISSHDILFYFLPLHQNHREKSVPKG